MNVMANRFETAGFRTIDANGHFIHYAEHGAGWRYDTLLEKEPETIEWIDSFLPGETLWDIGANVGIYSIYAGVKGVRTIAFEPHFANYHQLCVTIALNGLADTVTPLCLAFAEGKAVAEMNLASLDIGTSMSNFGEALDFRGKPFEPAFRQGMIGYDIDSFIADFGVEIPTHLKIDVDGIELPIVRGARRLLADERLLSVSIELIESDEVQVATVTEILENAGLHFVHKKQNIAFATPDTTDVLNYLFHRDPARLIRPEPDIANMPAAAPDDEAVTTDELIDRIAARIVAAPIDGAPSPNIFMEDMLPANVYRELLARLPGDDALDPIDHPQAIGADGRRTRYLLDLTEATLDRIAPEDQPFWEAMIGVFTAPEIAEAIVAKFEPALAARFGDAMPELVAVPVLYRDHPGYRIGVHPDTPAKIATLQFYLPADESQIHLGTAFHRRTADGFERLKTNPFRPNAAYGFVRTDESWHSVDELGPDEAVRNTIALTFYIKGEEYRSDAKPAADPQLSRALRRLAGMFDRRDDVATLFRAGGSGVQLGVDTGEFSAAILERSGIDWLYAIDPWVGGADRYRRAIVRLGPYRDRSMIMRMGFGEALPLFADESLDFVFIGADMLDGDGAIFRDWYPKLRPGGIMAGEGYAPEQAMTVAAVNAFASAAGVELHVIAGAGEQGVSPIWFAMKP